MKLGLGLPHLGPLASPAAIRRVAAAAEAAGLDSLWAMDRLLSPVSPRTFAYPGRGDGALPVAQQTVTDPLVALTIAATVTERVTVGADVLVAPWYAPVLLARSLAALDQASAGRLVVGLGLGWSLDEFEAVGVPMSPDTWFERLVERCLAIPGLPPWVTQHDVFDDGGALVGRVDLACPELLLGVEAHSRQFHFGQGPESLDPASREPVRRSRLARHLCRLVSRRSRSDGGVDDREHRPPTGRAFSASSCPGSPDREVPTVWYHTGPHGRDFRDERRAAHTSRRAGGSDVT